jgi:hypothetical protein
MLCRRRGVFLLERKWVARVTLVTLLCVWALGCEPIGRTRECRRLAGAVNAALTDVENLDVRSADPAKLRKAATRYEALAKELGDLGFRREQMAKDVAEYRQMFLDTARSLRVYAEATEKKDEGASRRTRFEVERHTRREKTSVIKIDAYCTAHH